MKKNNRRCGVLAHISSLPGGYSVGSFGREARRFIDTLAEGGFTLWQVLPFCATDECNSPYKSLSAFGANPYFIDLETLYEKSLISTAELRQARERSPHLCEFSRLSCERLPLLRRAAERILDRSEIISYVKAREELDSAATFFALRRANGDRPWYEWTVSTPDPDELFFWQFIQYEFFTEWEALHDYARTRGIDIIGDMPIYVSHDSCDVWREPDQFLLDADGFPTEVAGVPPDYFAKDGQLWGNPLYNWDKMRADGFSWWRRRLAFTLSMFDGVRIDHFRGFEAFWAVPRDAKTARAGRWVAGPGRELIDILRQEADDALIIAEDLGDITDEVRRLVEYSGFPGMRVFQFAFLGDRETPHLPHNFTRECVAYSGTHDNNTLLGYVWEANADTREQILEYCGASGARWEDGCIATMRTLMASVAQSVMLPVPDLAIYGADTRMNTPGTPENNWAFRISSEQMSAIPTAALRRLNELYGRI